MADNNTPNTTQQANTQPEGNGTAGKMFTQEEVNTIVRERLNRARNGTLNTSEQDERAAALDQREAAVQQREQEVQQKAAQFEQRELENALAQRAAGLKFSSESARKAFLTEAKAQNFAMKDGEILGFDDYVKTFKANDPSAILPEGGVAQFSASATGSPSGFGRDVIADAFKPKG